MLASVLIDNVRLYAAQSRERSTLTAIQASITEGLIVLDGDGLVVYFNGAAETLFAVAASSVKGQPFSDLVDARAPDFDDPAAAAKALKSLVDGSSKDSRVDLVMLRPQRLDLSMSSFPIALSPDEGMVGILVRDVTQGRDTFVSVASHELRTPMTTIIGFTDLLLDDAGEDGPQRRWLKYISEETLRLTEILDDMLDVSRIQSGNVGMTVERIAIDDSVAGVVAILAPTTEMHDFIVDCGPLLPKVLADRSKLSQVLMNLLVNAAHAIEETASERRGRITVTTRNLGDRVEIRIGDTGTGIPEAIRKKIFDPFFTTKEPGKGTGQGLAISHTIITKKHGGTIDLETEPGKGTTFIIRLPLEAPDSSYQGTDGTAAE